MLNGHCTVGKNSKSQKCKQTATKRDLALSAFWCGAVPDGRLQCGRGGAVCECEHETSAARDASGVCVVCYRIMQRL